MATVEGSRVKLFKQINIASETLYRMVLFNNGTELLVSDELGGLIHIYDLNGNQIDSINPESALLQPLGLLVYKNENNEEEVYIGDYRQHKIFVFNSHFELLRQFGDANILKIPQFLEIDNESKLLFVADTQNDEVTIWNVENMKVCNSCFFFIDVSLNFFKFFYIQVC